MKSQEALKLLPGLGKFLPVTSQTKKDQESLPLSMFTRIRQVRPSLKPVPKSVMQMKENLLLQFPPDTDSNHLKVNRGKLSDIHHVELYGL